MFTLTLLALLFFAIYKRQKQLTIFKKLRIPGPRPHFIFGHLNDIRRQGLHALFPKWTKKYGPIVGFFFGGRPQLLVTDPELIRRVLLKDFHKFSERSQGIPGGVHPVPVLQKMLPWTRYNAWKNLRASVSPSFSSAKLNAMEPLLMSSIDKLVSELDDQAKSAEEFNLKPLIFDSTFSIGSKCIFLLDFSFKKLSDEAKSFLDVAAPRLDKSILAMAMILFPSLTFIAYPLRVWWERFRFYMLWSPEGVCFNVTKKLIQIRKDAKIQSDDFLQLLTKTKRIQSSNHMDLEMSPEDITQNNNSMGRELSIENISDDEVASNALIFLLGSYESTAITLQLCLHNLVNHPSIQEELRTELRKVVDKGSKTISFSTLSQVPLVSGVMRETLRMYPPASVSTTRVANENYEYKGIVIPKGMPLFIGVTSIHNDPKIWPNPEDFQPHRFDGAFDKFSFLAFGAGPRNCIGIRFAYMNIQLILANLILNYRFESGPSTEKKVEMEETSLSLRPKNGLFCKVSRLEE